MHRRMVLFLLLALLLSFPARAEDYFLICRGKTICYAEKSAGRWVDTGKLMPPGASSSDRALLRAGMHLHGRAALSRALEDFCS